MRLFSFAAALAVAAATPLTAQTFPTADPVLEQIWREGMERSRLETLAQALLDSIGPRLTGPPGMHSANDWAVRTYASWGIEAWGPGTARGRPVEGPVVLLPVVANSAAFAAWLPSVRDRFIALSFPEPTCRPDENFEEWGAGGTLGRMREARRTAAAAWAVRIDRTGYAPASLPAALERAGARGILTLRWSRGWGVNKIFQARTERIPTVDLSCEDYGLVARLAERGQGPVLRVAADAEFLGDVPTFNTIAVIPGTERPDEYVMLSAHYDSWDGASGATDNGTGSVTMMEAMRILQTTYPNPKRTIIAALWSGEEQGLNGSRAFVTDHPEVVNGLQALFNQDNGTGRIRNISMQGLVGAGTHFARWFAAIPGELTGEIELRIPGTPGGGGSDYASFVCAGAPGFSLSSLSWDYGTYTWHKDPERVPRERRVLPVNQRTGRQRSWPECRDGAREWR